MENGVKEDGYSIGRSDRQEIERRAYEIYVSRGCGQGDALSDWLQAERELSEQGTPIVMPNVSKSKKPISAIRTRTKR
jgi:hypothetical protein